MVASDDQRPQAQAMGRVSSTDVDLGQQPGCTAAREIRASVNALSPTQTDGFTRAETRVAVETL